MLDQDLRMKNMYNLLWIFPLLRGASIVSDTAIHILRHCDKRVRNARRSNPNHCQGWGYRRDVAKIRISVYGLPRLTKNRSAGLAMTGWGAQDDGVSLGAAYEI